MDLNKCAVCGIDSETDLCPEHQGFPRCETCKEPNWHSPCDECFLQNAIMLDAVNSPKHYSATKIQPIDAIEEWGLGFHLGNVVKYIARAGKKDPSKELEDLKKAKWYLDRYIETLENK